MNRLSEVLRLTEDRAKEQYFFTPGTLSELVGLCNGYTALVCCPSVAAAAFDRGHRNFLLLDADTRMKGIFGELFQQYDLNRGVFSPLSHNPLAPRLRHQFDTVVIDPPYSLARPETLVQNAVALLKPNERLEGAVFVGQPDTAFTRLEQAFLSQGFVGQDSGIRLGYINPPRVAERKQLKLYCFSRA